MSKKLLLQSVGHVLVLLQPCTDWLMELAAAKLPLAATNKNWSVFPCLPDLHCWISDGESMVKSFEELGYATDLQFAQ